MGIVVNKLLRLLFYGIVASTCITYLFVYLKYGGVNVALALYEQREDGNVGDRVSRGNFDPSWSELRCENPNGQTSIPKKVHFIQITWDSGPSQLSFGAYLSIKSVILKVRPDEILIHHYNFDETNEWYVKLKDHVRLVQHSQKDLVGPQQLNLSDLNVPHQADVLRLNAVHQDGGIYMDSDIYALRSFDHILATSKDAIMGHEGANRYGLCNGVIIARHGSRFIERWMEAYADLADAAWNYHSVRLPKLLSAKYPSEICTLSPAAFFWPTWTVDDVEWMHTPLSPAEVASVQTDLERNGGALRKYQYAYHAWGPGNRKYISQLTAEKVKTEDTRFNLLVRPFVDAPI